MKGPGTRLGILSIIFFEFPGTKSIARHEWLVLTILFPDWNANDQAWHWPRRELPNGLDQVCEGTYRGQGNRRPLVRRSRWPLH
jgi:hypothetical protein